MSSSRGVNRLVQAQEKFDRVRELKMFEFSTEALVHPPALDGSGTASSCALAALVEVAVSAARATSATGPRATFRSDIIQLPPPT